MQNELVAALKRFWYLVGQLGRVKFLYDAIVTAFLSVAAGTMAWFAGLGLIAILIAVAVSFVLSLGSYFRVGKSSKTATTLDFVKNISISTNLPDAPALFGGTASNTLGE